MGRVHQGQPGLDHCYAERLMDHRLHRVQWGAGQERKRTSAANWRQPLLWEREHEAFMLAHGRRRRVFCASLADVFDNEVPTEWRADLFDLIANTPHLDWLLLTKRIGNADAMMRRALQDDGPDWPWPNVWLGATICNQEEADRDIPKLLATPAAVRFLSIEPMLGPVNLTRVFAIRHNAPVNVLAPKGCAQHAPGYCFGDCPWRWRPIDWVICGGESGPHARPMHPDWVRSLRDKCAAAGVPFHLKQHGEWATVSTVPIHPESVRLPGNLCRVQTPGQSDYYTAVSYEGRTRYRIERVGTKAAGRLLDGIEHNGFPT